MLDLHSKSIQSIDERRNIIIPGNKDETATYSVEHFINLSKQYIQKRGRFAVALSGGSTPKAIFEKLTHSPYKEQVSWKDLWLFWSDERSVPPTHPDSNYHTAMKAGLEEMPVPKEQIFRMEGEKDIIQKANEYDQLIQEKLGADLFDLVMLGMGEDGHTASLFPESKALEEKNALAAANFAPQKNTWRMTLTFSCINQSSNICLYVTGEKKRAMLQRILFPSNGVAKLPAECVGTETVKALWIVDERAASLLA